MRVLVVTSGAPFVRGDAEILADRLCQALSAAGHAAELVFIPFKPYPPNCIMQHMLACRLLDLTETCGARIDRVIALTFPAYLISHPNKVIWLLQQHRAAYERWDDPVAGDLMHYPDGPVIRDAIRQADRELIPEAKVMVTLSEKVTQRLQQFCGITGEPLYHPPPHAALFHEGSDEGYFFFPSRAAGVASQLLVIQALAKSREGTLVRFAGEAAGTGETLCMDAIRHLKVEDRVEWLGVISEEQKRDLYANCLGVLFPPFDEDYGYVTLEAMLSAKPVITCSDSGVPLEFVIDQQTGLVAGSTPESVACAMDTLWTDRRRALAMGAAGRARYADLKISWQNVMDKLLC